MSFLLDALLDGLLHTFIQPFVDPLIDPIARVYRRRLTGGLLVLIWAVTVLGVWAGVIINQRWANRIAAQAGLVLVLGLPFLAFISTLVLRDKMKELTDGPPRRAT